MLNLSGILIKIMDGTSEMLRFLEEEAHASTILKEPKQTSQTFLEETRNVKSSLIILAKASHHTTLIYGDLPSRQNPTQKCVPLGRTMNSTRETKRE